MRASLSLSNGGRDERPLKRMANVAQRLSGKILQSRDSSIELKLIFTALELARFR